MSRPHVFFFINSRLPELEFLSRSARLAFNYSSVATGVLLSRPSYEFSLLSRLHDIRSFNPCAPLLLQPPSASYISNAQPPSGPSTAKFLFLLNSLLHSSLVSYSIFLHINQSF